MRSVGVGAILLVALTGWASAGCGGDESSDPAAAPAVEQEAPDLNQDVAASEAPRGSDQRQIVRFANAWASDFSRGRGTLCVFMAGELHRDCRETYVGSATTLQRAFSGAKATRISTVTPRSEAGVQFSNGRYVAFVEVAELWKAFDLSSETARRYFEG